MNTPTEIPAQMTALEETTPLEPAQKKLAEQKEIRAFLHTLRTTFPVFQNAKPLAIGIDKELRAAFPDVSRKVLRAALGIQTHSLRYLKAMSAATERFNLQGETVDQVPEEHRAHAKTLLEAKEQKEQERRKTEARLRRETAREKAQTEARQAKLSLLVEKFGKK